MRELTYIVPPTADGRTLGSLLAREMKLSHHRISSLKFSGAAKRWKTRFLPGWAARRALFTGP